MRSLTALEAAARARAISVDSYDIALDLTRGSDNFGSRSEIAFRSLDGSATFLDVQAGEVLSVTLNGAAIDVGAVDDGRLALDGLAEHNTLVVEALMVAKTRSTTPMMKAMTVTSAHATLWRFEFAEPRAE